MVEWVTYWRPCRWRGWSTFYTWRCRKSCAGSREPRPHEARMSGSPRTAPRSRGHMTLPRYRTGSGWTAGTVREERKRKDMRKWRIVKRHEEMVYCQTELWDSLTASAGGSTGIILKWVRGGFMSRKWHHVIRSGGICQVPVDFWSGGQFDLWIWPPINCQMIFTANFVNSSWLVGRNNSLVCKGVVMVHCPLF